MQKQGAFIFNELVAQHKFEENAIEIIYESMLHTLDSFLCKETSE